MTRALTICLILTAACLVGCDECWRVSCANGGECTNGKCVCADGIERPFCKLDTCFENAPCIHGNCEYGFCICDENWSGKKCDSLTYIDHEGEYFGGFICDNYQVLSTVSVDKTSDKTIFDFYEDDYGMSYEGTFSDARNFVIYYQRARIYNNTPTYVEGSGYFENKELIMNLTYYTNSQADQCTFEGELKGL